MDRETFSNFGWIIIAFILALAMVLFATPLADFALDGISKLPDHVNQAAGIPSDNCKHENTRNGVTYLDYSRTQHQIINTVECVDCGKILSKTPTGTYEAHEFNSQYVCTKCGRVHNHIFDIDVSTTYEQIPGDLYGHYVITTKQCICGQTRVSKEKEPHHYVDGVCDKCGFENPYTNKYTISYNANGGTGAPDPQEKSKNEDIVLSSIIPTRTFYNFVGWGLAANSVSATYQPGDTYSNNESVTLYAVWEALEVIQIPSQNGTLTYNGSAQVPAWNNYDVGKMSMAGGNSSATNAGTYTIKFKPKDGYCWPDGSTGIKNVSWTIGRATITTGVPTQNGTLRYNSFTQYPSWNNYDENKLAISGTTSAVGNANSDTNYTAYFTPTINYKWSDGTTTRKSATWTILKCNHSSTHEEYVADSPTQHYKSVVCDLCGAETVASVLEPHEFINHVCWKCGEPESGNEPEDIYVVTFNPNGGTGGPDKMHASGNTTLPTDVPIKADYVCIGWSTNPSATSGTAPGGSYTVTSDITLYAVWQSEYVTITFNANGGSGGPTTQKVKYNEATTLTSSIPSKSGYSFSRWRNPPTGSPWNVYYSGGTYTFTSDMTLTAVWEENSGSNYSGGSEPGGDASGSGSINDNATATIYAYIAEISNKIYIGSTPYSAIAWTNDGSTLTPTGTCSIQGGGEENDYAKIIYYDVDGNNFSCEIVGKKLGTTYIEIPLTNGTTVKINIIVGCHHDNPDYVYYYEPFNGGLTKPSSTPSGKLNGVTTNGYWALDNNESGSAAQHRHTNCIRMCLACKLYTYSTGVVGDQAYNRTFYSTVSDVISHMPNSCIENCTHYQAGDTITYQIISSDTGACACGYGANLECVAVCPTCGGMVSKITGFCDNDDCEYYPYQPTEYEGWRWN